MPDTSQKLHASPSSPDRITQHETDAPPSNGTGTPSRPSDQDSVDVGIFSYLHRLSKAQELFIAAGILLGPAGYLVKARYLASYGVIPPIEFNLTYIIDGILFTIFCGLCFFPVLYAIPIVTRKLSEHPLQDVFRRLVQFSWEVWPAIITAVAVLASLTGVHEPVLTTISNTPAIILIIGVFVFWFFCAIAAFLYKIPDIFKQARINIETLFKNRDIQSLLRWMLFYLGLIGTILLLMCFLILGGASEVRFINNSIAFALLFLGLPIFIYSITLSALFFMRGSLVFGSKIGFDSASHPETHPPSTSWLYQYAQAIGSWLFVIALIVSFYVPNVYPYIPQSIGGGKLVPVTVFVSDDNAYKKELSDPEITTHILFRANGGVFFELKDSRSATSKVVEIPNSDIKGISYAP